MGYVERLLGRVRGCEPPQFNSDQLLCFEEEPRNVRVCLTGQSAPS